MAAFGVAVGGLGTVLSHRSETTGRHIALAGGSSGDGSWAVTGYKHGKKLCLDVQSPVTFQQSPGPGPGPIAVQSSGGSCGDPGTFGFSCCIQADSRFATVGTAPTWGREIRVTTADGSQTTADVVTMPRELGKGRFFIVWSAQRPRFVELLNEQGYPFEVKSLQHP